MREWVERRSTTQPTLTRRCAPASPWQREAFLCCFVWNRRQPSVRLLDRPNPTSRQCRGDPVGRPAGTWWARTPDDAVPSRTIAPGRRTASPLHAPRDRPSPGATRRPLPGRERRFFVASLGTGGSFQSAHSTDQTLPAGNVGATRWVARRGGLHVRSPRWFTVGPSCSIAPGRRTASPLQFVREGVRGRRNMLALRLQGDAPRRPHTIRIRAWCRRSRTRPAGNVGATRWVAHWVRSTYRSRVRAHPAGVHAGARAARRVARTIFA